MLKSEFQFLGYTNSNYVFIDKTNKQIKFSKCRKDLIGEFKLDSIDNNGKWFNVSYFQVNEANSNNGFADRINIISDMQLLLIR